MRTKKLTSLKTIAAAIITVATLNASTFAAAVLRTGSGANPAAIQAAVDQFRADLGGSNNGVGGSFVTGRREINWDGVPDSFSAPNFLPANFFNSNSPRGVVFSSSRTFNNSNSFIVSADSNNTTATPIEFGDIDPSYPGIFQTFSAERLFIARNSNVTTVEFFIPGTNIPATVSGFGAVFADVDSSGPTFIKVFLDTGSTSTHLVVPTANNGLSFAGISFNAGERITRVDIVSGNDNLSPGNIDNGSSSDLVVMDDFIYGEPRAETFHSGDFDGDGFGDSAIFRPSTGTWFRLNSGSNTVTQEQFGLPGDIPLDGDFDGDRRADVAIFRPSNGEWYFRRSSNGTVLGAQFGQNGDKPSVADYDKDGISDIAFWRPSNGNYFVLRSSSNFSTFFGYPFGINGDIPVQGGAQ